MAISYTSAVTLVATALLLRSTISQHSYSGQARPPIFGNFETQRHWNLPIRDWYRSTTDYELLYWGLDYPPLTTYHSRRSQYRNASYVELHKSRGKTSDQHKYFMRSTVLLTDALIYIPAILVACYTVRKRVLGAELFGVDLLAPGVFEDKVSNVWYIVNVLIKLRSPKWPSSA